MPSEKEYIALEDILSKTSITKYIETNWSSLRKIGSNYITLCPFHDDKKPSLSISEEKGLYHCFSCKAGGNLITFVKEFKNISSGEAIKDICDFFDIKFEYKELSVKDNTKKASQLIKLNSIIAKLYNKVLIEGKSSEIAIEYLKERGFSKKDIIDNEIGLAPESWDFLVKFIDQKNLNKGYSEEIGLIKKKENNNFYFDFFRNRIIFPIKNRQGSIIAFAGRSLNNDEPKYLNSKESQIFSKRKILYGTNKFSLLKGKKPKFVYIVEGYTDVLMMNKIGINNVVASMGTSLTNEHANEISKLSDKVVLIFDSDEAGLNASFKSIEPLFASGIDVYKLSLPDSFDPCDFIKTNGKSAFIDILKHVQPIMDSYIEYLKIQYLEKNKALNSIINEFLSKLIYVSDAFKKDILINNFCSTFSITKIQIEKKINSLNSVSLNIDKKIKTDFNLSPIEIALKVFVENIKSRDPNLLKEIEEVAKPEILKIINIIKKDLNSEPAKILTMLDDETSKYFSNILFASTEFNFELSDNIIKECILKTRLDNLKEIKRKINMKLSNAKGLSSDDEKALLLELNNIIKEEKKIKS
ncbi:DNA primase [bacterium]|nr:DNA primase [bacterium]